MLQVLASLNPTRIVGFLALALTKHSRDCVFVNLGLESAEELIPVCKVQGWN
jgi:hypothetical protein